METYVVAVTSLLVWFGLWGYLARVDRRVRELERRGGDRGS